MDGRRCGRSSILRRGNRQAICLRSCNKQVGAPSAPKSVQASWRRNSDNFATRRERGGDVIGDKPGPKIPPRAHASTRRRTPQEAPCLRQKPAMTLSAYRRSRVASQGDAHDNIVARPSGPPSPCPVPCRPESLRFARGGSRPVELDRARLPGRVLPSKQPCEFAGCGVNMTGRERN